MSFRTRRKLLALISGLALAAIPALEVAQAHSFSSSSSITIGGSFSGNVSSAKASCRRGRAVTVFKQRPGPDRAVGSDTTNSSGGYSVSKPNASGNFYAKVARRLKSRYGHSHECRGARSSTISV